MTKPELFNPKSKTDLQEKLQNELFERITCSFYRYVKISSLEAIRDALYLEWNELNILGRIYLAHEGINAQISVPEPQWDDFVSKLYHRKEFEICPSKLQLKKIMNLF